MTIEDKPASPEPGQPQEIQPSAAPQLSAIELRVIGVLMEKQLTTPDIYPLTVNSIITACNQKSSRDPISHYQQGEVERTLQALCDRRMVRMERGSRANKYEQTFVPSLQLGKPHQAVLCVMMLRGPQTLSELHTRTQRMVEFTDKEALAHCVARLCDRETPFAIRLGQQPGQRGERITHLFCGTPSVSAPPANSHSTHPTESISNPHSTAPESLSTQHLNDELELLKLELSDTQNLLAILQQDSIEQKKRLEALYALTGQSIGVNE